MEIKVDIEEFEQAVGKPAGRAMDKAIVRAANRTAPSVRLFVQKAASERFKLKRKTIVDRAFLMKATRETKYARLDLSPLRNIPRVYFGARPKKVKTPVGPRQGVTAFVNGGRVQIPGAFLATMPNGKVGVFERKGASRLPIKQLFGTEMRDLFEKDAGFLNSLQGHTREVFGKNFEADFAYFISREAGNA